MRLYHPRHHPLALTLVSVVVLIVAGCSAPQATQASINVAILADSQTVPVILPPGSTVQKALETAHLNLAPLDKTTPPTYTILENGAQVQVVRVTEKFEVEEVTIPFERQILRNESLSEDQHILLQSGKNGSEEITYRRVFEDGVETNDKPLPIKTTIIEEPIPEITMIGSQSPYSPVAISGNIYYLRDGNVWVMDGSTGNRRALITTGDLDGRVFSLSQDNTRLLVTRRSDTEGVINSLWVVDLSDQTNGEAISSSSSKKLIDLKISNIVHFADWVPGSNSKIVYSTVEPRSTAPGWQANNDLIAITFSPTGWTTKGSIILDPNSGGVYGWWGINFMWSPKGQLLAYSRPDSVGVVNFNDGVQTSLLDILPYQAHGDWAWVPGISWGPDGKTLYTVDHVPPAGSTSPEESQLFELSAISLEAGQPFGLVPQTGLFAYPITSPEQLLPNGETAYQVAFLQAAFPNQSDSSLYKIMIMDRDGSDLKEVFPPQNLPGISPQANWGAWSPSPLPDSDHYAIALIYQGNLWLVDAKSGKADQVTSDGLTTRVIWR